MIARALLAAMCVATGGCGFVLYGHTQDVPIDTAPAGGVVEVDGTRYGTPATFPLARGDSHTVIARNEHGAIVSRTLCSHSVALGHVLDMLTVPIIFNIIDLATGSGYELVPAQLVIPLPPPDAGPEYQFVQTPCR